MISESQLRQRLNYDDAHLRTLSGRAIADMSRRRSGRRRYALASLAACTAVLSATAYDAWERRPHVIEAEIAYASGPTLVLPDGRVDTGINGTRAWVDSEDRICFGSDLGSSCRPVTDANTDFTMFAGTRQYGGYGTVGGLVHEPIRQASFTTPDGDTYDALVIGFEMFPGWRVVVATIPRSPEGALPDMEDLTFTAGP